MSRLTVPTRALLGQLADLTRTAMDDPELPALSSILLHTDRGHWSVSQPDDDDEGDPLIDVVPTDLLIGSSTDRFTIGQAHTACDGTLHRPVLVPVADAKVLIAAFRPAAAAVPKDVIHKTVLTVEGDTLTAREDPSIVPDGVTVSFPLGEAEDFPKFASLMEPDTETAVRAPVEYREDGPHNGEVVAPSYGTAITPQCLADFAAIGKRRREPVVMYRHHQRRPLVIEIGSAYRGLMMPARPADEDERVKAPQIPVFRPGGADVEVSVNGGEWELVST